MHVAFAQAAATADPLTIGGIADDRSPVGASMSIDHILGLAACALLAGYLVYALLRPERF